MWREEATKEAWRCGGGGCVKSLMNKNFMGTKRRLLLLSGGRGASDVVGDWADKGLEGTGEGINVWPRVIVNGLDEVAVKTVLD